MKNIHNGCVKNLCNECWSIVTKPKVLFTCPFVDQSIYFNIQNLWKNIKNKLILDNINNDVDSINKELESINIHSINQPYLSRDYLSSPELPSELTYINDITYQRDYLVTPEISSEYICTILNPTDLKEIIIE